MTIIQTGADAYASDAIPETALGDEFLGWDFLKNYGLREEQIGAHHLRWPGGIPAEEGIDTDGDGVRDQVFSLTNPDLLDWDRATGAPREGFSDVIAEAIRQDNSFSLVVGESPYVDAYLDKGPEAAYALIRADVDSFVEKICAGEFGEMPKDFVVEIGSEYYATDVWQQRIAGGFEPKDMAYAWGSVSAVMSDAFKDAVEKYDGAAAGFEPKIAVQLGRIQSPNGDDTDGSPEDNATFISAFDNLEASGEIAPKTIDAVIFHRYLNNFDGLDNFISDPESAGQLQAAIDAWQALSVGETQLVVGWDSPDIASKPLIDADPDVALRYGSAVGSSTLQAFSIMAQAGMDYGTIFGTDVVTSGQYGLAGGKEVYFGGQLYGLMAESLPGTHLLTGIESNTPGVIGNAQVQDNTINTYAFEGEDKVVVFLAAKDFSGDSLDCSFGVEGAYSSAEITTLQGDNLDPKAVGVMETSTIDSLARTDGVTSLDLTFQSDFEVIRVVLSKDPTAAGGDPSAPDGPVGMEPDPSLVLYTSFEGESLHGGSGDDTIFAEHRDTTVSGWGGDDLLIAQEAGVSLYGNIGNDTLVSALDYTIMGGGEGDDLLQLDLTESGHLARGGDGADIFDITTGSAETTSWLADFDAAHDFLVIDGAQVDFDHLDPSMSMAVMGDAPMLQVGSNTLIFGEPDASGDPPPDGDGGSPDDPSHDDSADNHDDPSGGSCFVASAAYGDLRHQDVVDLRSFRDEVLLPHPIGRALIRAYWWIGPELARRVDSKARSGRAVRAVLSRIVAVIRDERR